MLVGALALRVAGTVAGLHEVTGQWRTYFRADSLAAGMLLAVVAVHRPATFDRLLRLRWLWAAVTAAGIGFLATVVSWPRWARRALLHRAAWVPRARRVTAPVAALGRYSYGVYIWHVLAAQLLGHLPGVAYESWTPVEQALKYGAALLAGIAATLLVEKPMLRLRERIAPAARTPAGKPTPLRRAADRRPALSAAA